MVIERFGVYLVSLDPAVGAEIRKTRPCVVVSPDDLNDRLHTVIIAPLTSVLRRYPFRVDSTFARRRGQIAVDQMRAIDKSRLVKRLGKLDQRTAGRVRKVLRHYFA